jgi:hypothetical protein
MNRKTNSISTLSPLLLFVIFTACILSVLLTGADTYRKFTVRDQINFQKRTTAQYLTTRVRQSDTNGMLFVADFTDSTPKSLGDTLYLKEQFGDRIFYTRICCHAGYLRELFTQADLDFAPAFGEKILEVTNVSFSIQDQLLTITITYSDNTTDTLQLQLRSNKEVPV